MPKIYLKQDYREVIAGKEILQVVEEQIETEEGILSRYYVECDEEEANILINKLHYNEVEDYEIDEEEPGGKDQIVEGTKVPDFNETIYEESLIKPPAAKKIVKTG